MSHESPMPDETALGLDVLEDVLLPNSARSFETHRSLDSLLEWDNRGRLVRRRPAGATAKQLAEE